ncbi:MAG TPA: substrate-binding domain-containing protein [Bryobacteraceae bacterium]|jgi:ribose transport system substrate-binding protein|nr:substrate-binding domain-containing protein [Bryobacteraceae bacterium]
MKTVPLIAVVFAGAVVVSSCSGGRHEPTEKYYLVAANIKLSYWQNAQAGLIHAARTFAVQAEMIGPDTYDPPAERDAFRKAVAAKPAGILVSAADPNIMRPEIDAAAAQGIPVITIDSDVPNSKRVTFVGTNNYQAGLMGGRVLSQKLNGKGNIVVFTMPGQANLDERLHGYKDAIGEHSGIKIVREVDVKGDPRIAFDTAEDIMNREAAKVDGFVCLEAEACKEIADVLNRRKAAGKVILAMDTYKETLEWIQKGVIAATIGQKPYTMAYFGTQMADDLHHVKPPTLDRNWSQDLFSIVPAFVDTGATLIDKSNVDAFLQAQTSAQANK